MIKCTIFDRDDMETYMNIPEKALPLRFMRNF